MFTLELLKTTFEFKEYAVHVYSVHYYLTVFYLTWYHAKYYKLLCELSKLSKLNAFILLRYLRNTDASILVYKLRPERIGFNMYAENTQQQLTILLLLPRYH